MFSVSPGSQASSHIQRHAREVSRLFSDLLSLCIRPTTIFSFVCSQFAFLLWFILVIVVIFMPLGLVFSGVWWLGASLTQLLSVFCLFSVILHFYCDFMFLAVILWLCFASFFSSSLFGHFCAYLQFQYCFVWLLWPSLGSFYTLKKRILNLIIIATFAF